MADWVSASMADFLPPGTQTIIDTIEVTIAAVSAPLTVVSDLLDTAKNFIVAFPLLDLLGALADLVSAFKEEFLLTGISILPMWDFPLRQLEIKNSYGPDQTYGLVNFNGTQFSDYIDDVTRSFYDSKDPRRPQYTSDCAMFTIVTAYADISTIALSTEEDCTGGIFPGISSASANRIRELRWQGAFRKMRERVELTASDKIEDYTDKIVRAFEKWSEFDDDEMDQVPIPNGSMDPFFENTESEDIDITTIDTIIEEIDYAYKPAEYPNWSRVGIEDIIPPFVELVNAIFDPVIEALQTGDTIKDQIVRLIDTVKARVQILTNLIDEIDKILDQLNELLNSVGFHAIFISSSTGINGLISKLRSAEDPFGDVPMFFAGMSLLVGGPSIAPFTNLLAPIAGKIA